MAYPLRMFIPGLGYFVTARCGQARYLMRPSRKTNEVLGGVLARGARLFDVEVFAFGFQSNHLHLLVRAPRGNLSKFMRVPLLANIAKKVGWLVWWRGTFWERRFGRAGARRRGTDRTPALHPLPGCEGRPSPRRCREWPGLSCLRMLLRGSPRSFLWFAWSKRWTSRNDQASKDRFHPRWAERETLQLAVLPQWAHLPQKHRARRVLELVRSAEREAEVVHERVLGKAGVLAQHPHHRPARRAFPLDLTVTPRSRPRGARH